ncbi:hypothetical protein H4S07_002255, partial [Coemansia furcata]
MHTPGMDTTVPKIPAAALNVAVNSERPAGQDVSDTDKTHTPAQPETFSTPGMDSTVSKAPAADIGGTVTGWLPVGWTGSIHGANWANDIHANTQQESRPAFGMDTTATAPVVDAATITTAFCQRFKILAHHFSVGRIRTDTTSSTKRVVRICLRKEPFGKARPFTLRRARHFAARRVLRRSGLVVYKRCAITSKLRIATTARAARRGISQDVDSANGFTIGWFPAGWTGAIQGISGTNVDCRLPFGWSYGNVGANVDWFHFSRPGASQVANSANGVHTPTQQVIQGSSGMSASVPAQPTSATSDSAKVLLP